MSKQRKQEIHRVRGRSNDSPRRRRHTNDDDSASFLPSPIHFMKSPDYWSRAQTQQQDDDESSISFDESPNSNLQFLRFADTPSAMHRRQMWNDDDESRNDDDDGEETETVAHQDAVEEAQLQVSFCEQTAREMEQVMEWWTNTPKDKHVSQSLSLKDNSLVYASEHSHDIMDDDDDDDDTLEQDASSSSLLFTTPQRNKSGMLFRSPSPCILNTNNDKNVTLEAFLSPILTRTTGGCPSPHRVAQEQSFAVDDVCFQTKHMEDVLADLEDTSVDGDDDASVRSVEPVWCSLDDLPWLDRLVVLVKCACHRCALELQQWLYHRLPPTLVSLWLEPSLVGFLCFLRVLLPAMLLLILLYTTTLISSKTCYESVQGLFLSEAHYYNDETCSREWNSVDSVCEFTQTVLL